MKLKKTSEVDFENSKYSKYFFFHKYFIQRTITGQVVVSSLRRFATPRDLRRRPGIVPQEVTKRVSKEGH